MFVGPGFVSTSPGFMRSSAIHPACPHDRLAQKNVKSGREVSTQYEQQFVSAVTDPPLVGCVVWSQLSERKALAGTHWGQKKETTDDM